MSPDLAKEFFALERLASKRKSAIAKAIADLVPLHRPGLVNPDYCTECARPWPCPPARVADDLRKALEES